MRSFSSHAASTRRASRISSGSRDSSTRLLIAGSASGYILDEYLLDIGTPEKLAQAENDIKNGKIKVVG